MARPRGRIQVGHRRPSHNQECRFFPPINYVLSYLRRRDSCSDAEVRANAIKSFILNGISLLSIYVFDLFLQPLTQEKPPQKWLHRSIGWFYRILWLLPLVGVSLYLNVRTRILHPCFLGQGTYLHRDCASAACLFCVCAGLMVLSRRKARFHLAARSCVSVRGADFDHITERVHRVSQLACHVCVSCRYDCDVHFPFVRAGLRPRHWWRSGNLFLLLGECVSRSTTMTGLCYYLISRKLLDTIALSKLAS